VERHRDRASASVARHPDVTGIFAGLQSAAPSVLVEEGGEALSLRVHGRATLAHLVSLRQWLGPCVASMSGRAGRRPGTEASRAAGIEASHTRFGARSPVFCLQDLLCLQIA